VALTEKYDLLEKMVAGSKKRTAGLTRRELEVLRLVFSGKSNSDIADELVLSRHTVVRLLSNVYSKLNVSNRSEASKIAVDLGLV
jgi:DNA-binding CsgD family transcriptional regulator